MWRIHKHGRSCFGQAIRLQHINTKIVEIVCNLRIEPGPSRGQITHLLPEGFVNLGKQNSPGVDAHFAQTVIEGHETLKHFPRERSSFFDLLEYPLVNQIKELRHHGEGGNVPLAQSAQKLGRVQSLQVDHARAFHQRQKQIRHLCQHVKHRQHAQQRVGGSEVDPIEHGFHFTQKVGVGKHHALGVGGGSRGVEEGSEVVQGRRSRPEFSWPCGKNRRQISQPVLIA